MIRTIKYDSWKEFKKDFYDDILKKNDKISNFVFRGQANETWDLTSSFDRNYSQFSIEIRKEIESNLIMQFETDCEKNLGIDLSKYSYNQKISFAQHYGIPTRLLDWSKSPYIASFFAYATANLNDSSNNDVAVWALNRKSSIWDPTFGCNIINDKIPENKNQNNQNAIFTLLQSTDKSLNEYVSRLENSSAFSDALIKVILPITDRIIALEDLDLMGINYGSLFSGIEGCAESAKLKTFVKVINNYL